MNPHALLGQERDRSTSGAFDFLAPQRRLRDGPGTDPLGGLRQDWKRSKKIQMDAQQQMKPPLSHLPDCNFFAYALQECVLLVLRKIRRGMRRWAHVLSAR